MELVQKMQLKFHVTAVPGVGVSQALLLELSVKNLQCDMATLARFHLPPPPRGQRGPFLTSPYTILLL